MYGKDCSKKCLCHTQATCDHVTGACTCTAGLSGKYCNITCPKGKYGVNCQQSCSCAHGKCDSAVGTCLCEPGWKVFVVMLCGMPCVDVMSDRDLSVIHSVLQEHLVLIARR
jgi:hypothetical protein